MEEKYNFEIPSVLKCQTSSCSWCPANPDQTVCVASYILCFLLSASAQLIQNYYCLIHLYANQWKMRLSCTFVTCTPSPLPSDPLSFSSRLQSKLHVQLLAFPDLTYVDPPDPVWRFCHAWVHSAAAAGLRRNFKFDYLTAHSAMWWICSPRDNLTVMTLRSLLMGFRSEVRATGNQIINRLAAWVCLPLT